MCSMDLKYTELHDDQFGITMRAKNVLYRGKSDFQEIDIIDTEFFGKVLLLDGLVMTTEKDEVFYHEMIVHIPMLSHPEPKDILVIGGGDGGTIREVLRHPSVKRAVLCEIDGEVIEVCKKYMPQLAGKLDDPRVDIQVRDGIEYIANSKNEFDVILIDSTDPMGPGEGLFTEEFYKNVNAALKQGGIMVCQSESPFADQKEIKMMQPLLKKAFPIVKTYVGPMPTYPGGYWSWTFCSNTVKPLEFIDEARADEITKGSKIYNKEVHKAAFALPNFVKELVGE
ncbi:MAG: polyamine aminopropyltransferase [Candidatus Gastranaerophilales bacterium]|nr:polyamine aminopropyltransferase [Candidatus Gastranaerophilales bacterium]